jgi:hypothetical protein
MPAPTAWPIALAFGITLLFAGMVTSASRQRAGSDCRHRRRVGWFRDVLPHEAHESVPVARKRGRHDVRREVVRMPDRARIAAGVAAAGDLSDFRGVKGGLAGSVAMAVWRCSTVS